MQTSLRPRTSALLERAEVTRIFSIFDGDGEETRLVGGALRNALTGRHVHEYDFATTALPETVQARATAAGLKSVPTGIEHGTITVIIEGEPFEITTLREDVETDGRHALVSFGRDFALDAHRRDFTINALSMDRKGRLYDYTNGLADLAAGRVRFIGDARQRIVEDYLRILRFFRFSAEFAEGSLDREGFHAAIREKEGLRRLSAERVHVELLKLLSARRSGEIIPEIAEAGLFAPLLPLVPHTGRLARFIAIGLTETQDPILRLAALFTEIRENVVPLRGRLALSNAETTRLDQAMRLMEQLHGEGAPNEAAIKALLLRHRSIALGDAFLLQCAQTSDENAAGWQLAHACLNSMPQPKLPFSGADLLALGVQPGPIIGQTLQRLEQAWIEAGFPDNARDLNILRDRILATVPRKS
ncbi:CCA tRNA nucleotidyltransferase [Beijerinckia mobilis]|uniref:CCA tRNA nucleotidyltransferase n=1 Tax=Beijerinckia mobilis TaxID=231434 RepID=UPI000554B3E5|nr:CCA tRNA nucleotidyltransferase [Beijerinckia mobilis]